MPERYKLKQEAKTAMRGRHPSVYVVFFAYLVILYVLELLSKKVAYPWMSVDNILRIIEDPDALLYYASYAQTSAFANVVSIAIDIMIVMLGIGFTIFALRVSRHIAAGFGDLFDAFGMFFKFLWLSVLVWLFTFLWSLLLVVPGVIASYRYRMAFYIMLDNPELSAIECVRRSREMMLGHKMELFVLDLSFILWNLLSVIPFVSIYVTPYIEVTNAVYYNHLSGSLGDVEGGFENGREGSWNGDRDPWEN